MKSYWGTGEADCHTSDIGHWFAMTHYMKCGRRDDVGIVPYELGFPLPYYFITRRATRIKSSLPKITGTGYTGLASASAQAAIWGRSSG